MTTNLPIVAVLIGCSVALTACESAPVCPDVHDEEEIDVPASQVLPSITTLINAQTNAAPTGTAVSIVNNQGTVAFQGRGPAQAFIYNASHFPTADSELYGGLAIVDGAWLPFWLYCSSDGLLTNIYGEMTDRDSDVFEAISGTCVDTEIFPTTPMALPAHTLRHTALTCCFTVQSTDLELAGSQPGSGYLAGGTATILPFHTVDCRTGCGSPGWFEVHAVAWNPTAQQAAFEIIYLDAAGVSLDDGYDLATGQPVGGGLPIPGAVWTLTR